MIKKIIVYITRLHNRRRELLVCVDKGRPEAGIRVLARMVGENETVADALYREAEEKCSLTHLISKNKIKEYIYYDEAKAEYHERHVFHLEVADETREKQECIISSLDQDAGVIFDYNWVPIEVVSELETGQDDGIHLFLMESGKSAYIKSS
ncbi:NUDIX domain-containing protein [Priestia abyssalis]|uniref:NUDIX domain-containing protein n=1 Tax=Priestia abyssalis TaxID=1221450 RepID=UPI001F2C28E8|nr:NUDIX domain-containing protein [Priestia abyssalis]